MSNVWGTFHGDLIGPEETVILICLQDVSGWVKLREELARAARLKIPALIVIGKTDKTCLGALLWGAMEHSAEHGRRCMVDRETGESVNLNKRNCVFSISPTLAQILGIYRDDSTWTRNGLVLISKHRVVAQWAATDRGGSEFHDWSHLVPSISRVLKVEEDEVTALL